MKKLSWSAAIALLTAAVCVSPASAQVAKCQRTIAKANSQFVQARVKALAKCEEGVVKSGTGTCPDAKAQASVDKAEAKMVAAIGKSCGGADKVCGGDTTGEFDRNDLGWPLDCPAFEKNGCTNTISATSCEGISECLACIGGAATDQAIDLYYDSLVLPSGNDKVLNKCQIAIGKASSAFLNSKSKALQKCQDARLNGKHNLDCFPPSAGDGKYAAAIAKAEAKKIATICKACGGPDKACGGGDDLTVANIGFPAVCPPLTIPHGGTACGGPITDLNSLVACVDCVTEFKAECTDAIAVPQFETYPAECNACTAPAASGPCPTSFEFTADGARTDLDAGVSGLGHNAGVPSNGRLTLAVSGCAGANQPTCGQCNISGPLTNAGGVTFNNHRCADKPWVQCVNDGDCISGGAAGPCIFFFGAPLPLVAGGVPTCILNQINGPIAGTVNLDDGTSTANVPLISKVHPVGTVFNPCPICEAGQCSDGDNINGACTVNGTGIFGDVSLDCPPASATLAGSLQINLNIATGTQTVTVSAANPTCRETGYNSFKCLCDTCNNANQEACMTNADCPISGGNPGICGGRRCIGGPNEGSPCAVNSECPTGLCNRPGEATKPNACQDDTTNPGLDCVAIGGNEGECANGPYEQVCSIQTSKSCSTSSDCICPECLPNQVCITKTRPCFTDNGVVGASIDVVGKADAPCAGVARPTVGTFFCVAPVAQGAVNAASGLPGLGRVRIPGVVVVSP